MEKYEITKRSKLVRGHKRANYEKKTIHSIIDEALYCSMGLQLDDRPYVRPHYHWRYKDKIYFHGSTKNRLFKALEKGAEACLSFTIIDGLVMSRSAFHHSVNYRSVMLFSHGEIITDNDERVFALKGMVERFANNRWQNVRDLYDKELKATSIIAFKINEVSAKISSGDPSDEPEDLDYPTWAGVLPLEIKRLPPISSSNLSPEYECDIEWN